MRAAKKKVVAGSRSLFLDLFRQDFPLALRVQAVRVRALGWQNAMPTQKGRAMGAAFCFDLQTRCPGKNRKNRLA